MANRTTDFNYVDRNRDLLSLPLTNALQIYWATRASMERVATASRPTSMAVA